MAVLVLIVSRPYNGDHNRSPPDHVGGFRALKPAISHFPQFLEMLVSRLSSADHALCANALQLINALMRDAVTVDDESEWPKFIKRIQDLGVIKAVYVLMRSSALQDLAHPLLEFQQLTKVLLSRWRNVLVDIAKPEHRRTIKAIHLSSNPPEKDHLQETKDTGQKPKHDPHKWRRLGFTAENPEPDFEDMGFLGMMDFSDYVRKHQDEFQNILAEQELLPLQHRCPLARVSLVVTAVLFEHFEVDKLEEQEAKAYLVLESRTNHEHVFKPLLLHWSRLHVAGLHAFLRLWRETGADVEDFHKITELVRILIESVVGGASRTKGIESIEQELAVYKHKRLRELQMELLDLAYEDLWGQHLQGTRDDLQNEALQFVREQRIRCLLAGTWFPHNQARTRSEVGGPVQANDLNDEVIHGYRFIQLSKDRKNLHWADFEEVLQESPRHSSLPNIVSLSLVSSVVSNITATEDPTNHHSQMERYTTTRITIHGYETRSQHGSKGKGHARKESKSSTRANQKEIILLTFQPPNHIVASEWLDGLLMLLDQQPITAETNKIIKLIGETGLKVRLLNVRGNDEEAITDSIYGIEAPPVPSREALDDNYFYEI